MKNLDLFLISPLNISKIRKLEILVIFLNNDLFNRCILLSYV